jgi:Xaa-Pro aminopeptidase
MPDIPEIQEELRANKLDGWLFYDHHHRDPIAAHILGLDEKAMVTRRWYYFIPAKGDPRKLSHRIEQATLESLPGKMLLYSSWEELHKNLRKLLTGATKIAMQYSPENNIPYIGLVDAGTIELLRSMKKKIVSSAGLVQEFEATWSDEQLQSHLQAGKIIDRVTQEAFVRAADFVRQGKSITELDLQAWIMEQFRAADIVSADPVLVAVQPNNGNPHYMPEPGKAQPIRAGDLLLLDMFGKFSKPRSVYYDISWMGYLGSKVPDSYARAFRTVRQARDEAIGFIKKSIAGRKTIMGWQVDKAARDVIKKAGYGEYFVHRTGHSIGIEVHGNGANMDGLETRDDRKLVPHTCFSIEPGIYTKEFGLRTEVNVYVGENEARVTGAIQEQILPLLS